MDIKPCPFGDVTCHCDDLEIVTGDDPQGRAGIKYGYVECDNCGARGPIAWADEANIEAAAAYSWNERRPKGLGRAALEDTP